MVPRRVKPLPTNMKLQQNILGIAAVATACASAPPDDLELSLEAAPEASASHLREGGESAAESRSSTGAPVSFEQLRAAPSGTSHIVEAWVFRDHCPLLRVPCDGHIWLSTAQAAHKGLMAKEIDLYVAVEDPSIFEGVKRIRALVRVQRGTDGRPTFELVRYEVLSN